MKPTTGDKYRAAYAEGAAVSDIARRYGVSRQAVHAAIQYERKTVRATRKDAGVLRTLSERQAAQLVRRYEAGESVCTLAGVFGIAQPTVHRILDAAGVRKRSRKEAAQLRWSRRD